MCTAGAARTCSRVSVRARIQKNGAETSQGRALTLQTPYLGGEGGVPMGRGET